MEPARAAAISAGSVAAGRYRIARDALLGHTSRHAVAPPRLQTEPARAVDLALAAEAHERSRLLREAALVEARERCRVARDALLAARLRCERFDADRARRLVAFRRERARREAERLFLDALAVPGARGAAFETQ